MAKRKSMASIDAEFSSQEERDEWIEEQKRLEKEGKPPFRFNHTPTDADIIRSEKKDMRAYDEWAKKVGRAYEKKAYEKAVSRSRRNK